MIVFVIYNIIVSLAIIFFSKHLINNINEDIKKDKKDMKYYDNDWLYKCIKVSERFKIFFYTVIVLCISCIIFTLIFYIIYIIFIIYTFNL